MISKRRSPPGLSIYEQNRQKFSIDELRRFQGMWVGFSEDGARILAADPDLSALSRKLEAEGFVVSETPVEYIDFEDISLGGAAIQ